MQDPVNMALNTINAMNNMSRRDILPKMVGHAGAMSRQKWHSPHNRQLAPRQISASREVNGPKTPNRFNHSQDSMSARGRDPNRSTRKVVSNLPERKRAVLRIASENFLFVKRLERVRSAIGPGGS